MPTDSWRDEPAATAFNSRASDAADMAAIDEFIGEGMVTAVLGVVKSGKEATVYRCRGGRLFRGRLLAAKVYHDAVHRSFARSAAYEEGRYIKSNSARHAIAKRTDLGRQLQLEFWVEHEFETLSKLGYLGADVPEVFACTERAILMEFVGDEGGPAPLLQHADVPRDDAPELFDRLLWNIELWLREDIVHGDLSAFNILYTNGRAIVIDFPQAIDPRVSPVARKLLERDIGNVVQYFGRYGIEADAGHIAARLWGQFTYGWSHERG